MTDDLDNEAAWFEAQAETVEGRAARVLRLAAHARLAAEQDVANGNRAYQTFHVREAQAHEGSAAVLRKTAALYRVRAQDLRRATRPTTRDRGLPPNPADMH